MKTPDRDPDYADGVPFKDPWWQEWYFEEEVYYQFSYTLSSKYLRIVVNDIFIYNDKLHTMNRNGTDGTYCSPGKRHDKDINDAYQEWLTDKAVEEHLLS